MRRCLQVVFAAQASLELADVIGGGVGAGACELGRITARPELQMIQLGQQDRPTQIAHKLASAQIQRFQRCNLPEGAEVAKRGGKTAGLLTAHAERQGRDLGQRARQFRREDGGAFVGLVIAFTLGLEIHFQLGDVSQCGGIRQVDGLGLLIHEARL